MKKIILLCILFFIIPIAFASWNDSGEVAMNGGTPSDGDALSSYNWTDSCANSQEYNSSHVMHGTLGIAMENGNGGFMQYTVSNIENFTFGTWYSDYSKAVRCMLRIYMDGANYKMWGVDTGQSNTKCAYVGGGDGWTVTDHGYATGENGNWTHIWANITDKTIKIYCNDNLLQTDTFAGGATKLQFSLDNGASADCFYDQTYFLEGYEGIVVDDTVLTNSSWNVTSNNTIGSTSAWIEGGTVNVTSDLVTASFTTNVASNCSVSLYDMNYTTMVGNNSEYKLATTETTSHAFTLADDLSIGSQCLYVACIQGNGKQDAKSTSGCLSVNRINYPPSVENVSIVPVGANYTNDLYSNYTGADNNSDVLYYSYRWYINGDLASTAQNITSVLYNGKDVITLSVQPFDNIIYGSWVNSSNLTILDSVNPILGRSYTNTLETDNRSTLTFNINVTDAGCTIEATACVIKLRHQDYDSGNFFWVRSTSRSGGLNIVNYNMESMPIGTLEWQEIHCNDTSLNSVSNTTVNVNITVVSDASPPSGPGTGGWIPDIIVGLPKDAPLTTFIAFFINNYLIEALLLIVVFLLLSLYVATRRR